jgi:hypothetical protein
MPSLHRCARASTEIPSLRSRQISFAKAPEQNAAIDSVYAAHLKRTVHQSSFDRRLVASVRLRKSLFVALEASLENAASQVSISLGLRQASACTDHGIGAGMLAHVAWHSGERLKIRRMPHTLCPAPPSASESVSALPACTSSVASDSSATLCSLPLDIP